MSYQWQLHDWLGLTFCIGWVVLWIWLIHKATKGGTDFSLIEFHHYEKEGDGEWKKTGVTKWP